MILPRTARPVPCCDRTGAATDLTFLSLRTWLGYRSFVVFAVIAGAGGVYVWRMLPETRGATLAEVQRLLENKSSGMAPRSVASHACSPCMLLREGSPYWP